jgi:hypothetical protein
MDRQGRRLYPMPTPHEFIDAESRDQDGDRVPVFVADEIAVKFSRPLVGHIFPLVVFRANRSVNVMPNLVEENVAKDNVPQDWDTKRNSLQSANDFVYSKLDVR